MKNIFLFYIISFFLFSCTAKKEKTGENSLADSGFKGKVKVVTEYSYAASGDSVNVLKGKLTCTTHWIYNEKGYWTEWNIKDSNAPKTARYIWQYDSCEHLITDSEGSFVEKFRYDKTGNRVGMIQYSWDSGKCKIDYSQIYKVDDTGNRIEEDSYSGSTDSLYKKEFIKNNDQGLEIERTIYDDRGNLTGKETRVYDAKGNQTEYRSYGRDSIFLKSTYTYDASGREIQNLVYHDGKVESSRKSKYDDKGNVVDFETIFTRGSVIKRTTSLNESFDKEGNSLKSTILTDGQPSSIEERTIEYYP